MIPYLSNKCKFQRFSAPASLQIIGRRRHCRSMNLPGCHKSKGTNASDAACVPRLSLPSFQFCSNRRCRARPCLHPWLRRPSSSRPGWPLPSSAAKPPSASARALLRARRLCRTPRGVAPTMTSRRARAKATRQAARPATRRGSRVSATFSSRTRTRPA